MAPRNAVIAASCSLSKDFGCLCAIILRNMPVWHIVWKLVGFQGWQAVLPKLVSSPACISQQSSGGYCSVVKELPTNNSKGRTGRRFLCGLKFYRQGVYPCRSQNS